MKALIDRPGLLQTLHAIGLTNLSDLQVGRYSLLRLKESLGQLPRGIEVEKLLLRMELARINRYRSISEVVGYVFAFGAGTFMHGLDSFVRNETTWIVTSGFLVWLLIQISVGHRITIASEELAMKLANEVSTARDQAKRD